MSKTKYDHEFKIILIGSASVGKSSIMSRYIRGSFYINTNQTIGVQYSSKQMNINGLNILIHLWDTAGQERYRSLTRQYYRDSNGVILCYDVTNEDSIADMTSWIQELKDINHDTVPIIVVGNKIDIYDKNNNKNQTSLNDIKIRIDDLDLENYDQILVSACTGENIHTIFEMIVSRILKHKQKQKQKLDHLNNVNNINNINNINDTNDTNKNGNDIWSCNC